MHETPLLPSAGVQQAVYLLLSLLQASCCQRVYDVVFGNRCVTWLLDAQERLLRTTLMAMIMDVLGVLLYIFDMYTDIKVGLHCCGATASCCTDAITGGGSSCSHARGWTSTCSCAAGAAWCVEQLVLTLG